LKYINQSLVYQTADKPQPLNTVHYIEREIYEQKLTKQSYTQSLIMVAYTGMLLVA